MIRLAADHHAVDLGELDARLLERPDAAVRDHLELGEVGLEAVDHLVAERRDLAVLLGAEPGEPSLARVHDHRAAARGRDRLDEPPQEIVVVALVDADPGLDRDRHAGGGAHRRDARRDQLGLGHQAGAEARALDPVRGQPTLRLTSS